MPRRRKRTPEERAEELRRRDEPTRKLQERIAYYEAKIAAAEREARGQEG